MSFGKIIITPSIPTIDENHADNPPPTTTLLSPKSQLSNNISNSLDASSVLRDPIIRGRANSVGGCDSHQLARLNEQKVQFTPISIARARSPRPDEKIPYRLYYCPEMKTIAEQIAKLYPTKIQLGEIRWNRFADGFPDLFIEKSSEIKWYHVVFLASFHHPSVVFEQYSIASVLPKALPKSYKVILPFYPTGTMERVSRPGEVATANSLARILSTIPSCAKGPAQITIFDIHALQNQFYFKDTVLIRLGTCINLLLQRLSLLEDVNNINIAFPDDGAHKRFGDMFHAFPSIVICHKVRDGDKRVVKIKEGDIQGKHIIIVDDLAQSGGTLIECAKELKRAGAEGVSAYVTHAVFPKESWKKFIKPSNSTEINSGDLFNYFWVTDSNPVVTDLLRGKAPFEVLHIANNIAEHILDEVAD
jgi:ribose-phosphate pyrophosphokinase